MNAVSIPRGGRAYAPGWADGRYKGLEVLVGMRVRLDLSRLVRADSPPEGRGAAMRDILVEALGIRVGSGETAVIDPPLVVAGPITWDHNDGVVLCQNCGEFRPYKQRRWAQRWAHLHRCQYREEVRSNGGTL